MKKDTIVQFVGFVTDLELDVFAPQWEKFARRLMSKKAESTLQQQATSSRTKYRYISKHEWPEKDFHFSFMNERRSEHFPEHHVRVVQTGGYTPLPVKKRQAPKENDIQLIAFLSHEVTDLEFFTSLPQYRNLDIHQAYYESCSFGYVLEFFVPEEEADELLLVLKQRPGVEASFYKECLVAHL